MEEKTLSEQESFFVIEQMIAAAKNEYRQNGGGWLIWGWLLFLASINSIVLIEIDYTYYIQWTWCSILPLGFLLMFFYNKRHSRQEVVTTYLQDLFRKFNIGFFVSLTVIVASNFLGVPPNLSFGYFYILYAFWMFMNGSALRFKPLIVGAIVNWCAAIAIFLVHDFKQIMIISAIAVLVGYLIPGQILSAKYKRSIKAA